MAGMPKQKRDRTQRVHTQYTADQSAYFDQLITADWDTYERERWDRVRAFEVARIFERVRPRRILDVGCGSGYHDLLMADQPGVEEVLGIDYSPKSVAVANQKYPHPKVARRVADLFEVKESGFDLAISFQVIEHVVDPAAFLRACADRVRGGGSVVALTPNRERLLNRFRRASGLRLALEDPQHFAEYTVEEMSGIGERVGLRFVGAFSYGLSFYLPRLGWQVIPQRWAHLWGRRLPPLADRFGIFFERPDQYQSVGTIFKMNAPVASS